MAIKFAAGTPQEAPTATILKPGEYEFEVIDAKEKALEKDGAKLKAGTPLIELKLRVNGEATVFDNLFFADATFWKVDAFLKSINKHPGDGEVVEIDCFELIGEKGSVRIKTGKTQGGQPRNEVDAYTWDK
jgi:hypothetical protein